MNKLISRIRNSKGFALGLVLIVAIAAALLLFAIVTRSMLNTRQAKHVLTMTREEAAADGDIHYALAMLQKRIKTYLPDRITNGFGGNYIKDTDLVTYNTTNPGLFWTQWMNDIDAVGGTPEYPNFSIVDSSVAAYNFTVGATTITVHLHYANDKTSGSGSSNYNDFILRYYYEVIVENAEKHMMAKSYFFDDASVDNCIQIHLWRSLSSYNLFTEWCTDPLGNPVYDGKSYSGQVYSRHRFYSDVSAKYAKTVHISNDALTDGGFAVGAGYYWHKTLGGAPGYKLVTSGGIDKLDTDHAALALPVNLTEANQRSISYYGKIGGALPATLTINEVYGATETIRLINGAVEISSTCIYVKGDAYIKIETLGDKTTTHYIIQSPPGTLKYTLIQNVRMAKDAHQVIFVDGSLRVEGDLALGSKTTIAAKDDIIICGPITYLSLGSTPPWPSTVLGLISWQGNILFAKNIPGAGLTYTLNVHAVLMAPTGGIGTEDYLNINAQNYWGIVEHQGCIIRYYCLPTLSSDYLHGWAFKSYFDEYLETQKAPPFFPANGNYKLYTDKLNLVDIYSTK
jgi:hypothetical protein